MALAESQAVLARIYTDSGFRDEFLKSPESAATSLGISIEEARNLADQCGDDARVFARSLHAKRCKEAAAYLPLTLKSLGVEPFRALFFRHAADFLPQGTDKPKSDAIAFARWLVRSPTRNDDEEYRDAAALARYESAALEVSEKRGITIRLFLLPSESGRTNPVLSVWIHFGSTSRRFNLRIPRVHREAAKSPTHAS